jgi:TrmH family RNA methyltransferase
MLITSRHNPRVKAIRGLLQRKHRDREQLLLADGVRLVRAAVEGGMEFDSLIEAPEVVSEETKGWLDASDQLAGVPRTQVSPDVLRSLSAKHWRQGIAAVVRQQWSGLDELLPSSTSVAVAVREIRQPWSIGNIIRICEAVGGSGVLLVGDSADPHHPAAVRASVGTVFSQRLVRTTLDELAEWKQQRGCLLVGTSPSAASDYREAVYRWPLVLLAGSERVGLSPEEKSLCDVTVRIPMMGTCDSHHVVVATALVLYEVYGQAAAAGAGGR